MPGALQALRPRQCLFPEAQAREKRSSCEVVALLVVLAPSLAAGEAAVGPWQRKRLRAVP